MAGRRHCSWSLWSRCSCKGQSSIARWSDTRGTCLYLRCLSVVCREWNTCVYRGSDTHTAGAVVAALTTVSGRPDFELKNEKNVLFQVICHQFISVVFSYVTSDVVQVWHNVIVYARPPWRLPWLIPTKNCCPKNGELSQLCTFVMAVFLTLFRVYLWPDWLRNKYAKFLYRFTLWSAADFLYCC